MRKKRRNMSQHPGCFGFVAQLRKDLQTFFQCLQGFIWLVVVVKLANQTLQQQTYQAWVLPFSGDAQTFFG